MSDGELGESIERAPGKKRGRRVDAVWALVRPRGPRLKAEPRRESARQLGRAPRDERLRARRCRDGRAEHDQRSARRQRRAAEPSLPLRLGRAKEVI